MNRIAMVIQRYGTDFSGGAEFECRTLAEHLCTVYDVEVLTSCAKNPHPWRNDYDEGIEIVNGVAVRRFLVRHLRDEKIFRANVNAVRRNGERSEEDYIKEVGPYCPELPDYLFHHHEEFEAIMLFVYVSYTTLAVSKLRLPNIILVPTAHDEPLIYLPVYHRLFARSHYYLFNSVEEKEFLEKTFHVLCEKCRITCFGLDLSNHSEALELEEPREKYLLYVGRLTQAKGVDELLAFFCEFKRRNPGELKLLLLGSKEGEFAIRERPDIEYLGFVPESEKWRYLRGAIMVVMPSFYESLSIVILEAMATKTPVLVNARCDVLMGQVARSSAGMAYRNYFQFESAIKYMLSHLKERRMLGENGYNFVMKNYRWSKVINQVTALINEVSVAESSDSFDGKRVVTMKETT